jgi:hypothetical protein
MGNKDLATWYSGCVRRIRRRISEIPDIPDRYQHRFYVGQAFLRFRDYWEARIMEEAGEPRPNSPAQPKRPPKRS